VKLAVKFLRSRRGLAAVAGLLVIMFLWRPGVYRLRNRIAISIGSALGRRVALDNVRLRLLPRPGFDLEGLVIYDDPAFGAEPLIRAQEVSAAIRLRSLLRGRLEIATLSASEPSVNLVRNDEGHWNLASLVERNARIPAAPTGKPASERPAFPYLEASNARVNFKIEQTKKSYALMDADVALWQDSENSWSARIKAEPVRTDFHLTDTGMLQINATWQRAASLPATPVQITAQWRNGQLGQITELLSGKDRGWRGGVDFAAKLSGTPEALRIESQTVIEDFHRYDIVDRENVRLAASCAGKYDTVTSALTGLLCESPVSDGILRLRGTLDLAPQPAYDLTIEAERVPLASAVRLLRQAKKQVSSDLTATGLLNAEFHAVRNLPDASEHTRRGMADNFLQAWTGSGSATNVRLSSNSAEGVVAIGTIPLTLVSQRIPVDLHSGEKTQVNEQEPTDTHLRIGPIAFSMNASAPMNGGGWVSAAGYRFFLRGDMELKDLFRLESMLALPVTRPAAEGSARLDVSASGPWQGFATPSTIGTAQLRNVRAEMRGLNTPIQIASATMTLTPSAVSMQKISARIGTTHWSGEVISPRHCGVPDVTPTLTSTILFSVGAIPSCTFQFDLTADELSTGDLAEWFIPHPAERPWYHILSAEEPGRSPLLSIDAQGNLHVGRFAFKKLVASQIASQVDVRRGVITLGALRGQLLQGRHLGRWTIDASHQPVVYHGSGALQDVSLPLVATLMNDAWITGTADGTFDLDGSGDSFHELLSQSGGKLQFVMRNGSLPHVEIPGSSGALMVHRFTGKLGLKKGVWELSDGKLESRDGIYQVSGMTSAVSGFDFALKRGDEQSWTLTGTLAKPRVALVNPAVNPTETQRAEAKRAEAETNTVKP